MRTWFALRSAWLMKRDACDPRADRDVWQAGRSVAANHSIEPVADIVRGCAEAVRVAG